VPKTYEIPTVETVTQEQLNDLLVAAVEGGTGYWGTVRNYNYETEDAEVEIAEEAPEGEFIENIDALIWHKVKASDFVKILPRLREIPQHKGQSLSEIMENHDAETGDCAMQFLLFGEIKYG
jgi:hypothetical protein